MIDGSQPRISVIIAAYNAAEVLHRCLIGLAAQSHRDFEVVLVDDGSTDGWAEVAGNVDLGASLSIVHQSNAGPSKARNHGVRRARGEFVIFLDADDEVAPRWLEVLAHILESCSADMACCGAKLIRMDDDSAQVRRPRDMGPAFYSQTAMFFPASYLVRKQLFCDAGGFADIGYGEHHELGLRLTKLIAARGLTACSTQESLVTKYHDRAPHRVAEYDPGRLRGARYKLSVHAEQLSRDPDLCADYHGVAGVAAIRLGLVQDARRHFASAARLSGWNRNHLARLALSSIPGVRSLLWRRRDWLERFLG